MELVYLWVEDYKNIHKQGFNFSPRFNCEYDEEKNELTIDENNKHIENFFGDNINVTTIVGKNGSGKSTILELISFLRMERIQKVTDKKTILIFENENKLFTISNSNYMHEFDCDINMKNETSLVVSNESISSDILFELTMFTNGLSDFTMQDDSHHIMRTSHFYSFYNGEHIHYKQKSDDGQKHQEFNAKYAYLLKEDNKFFNFLGEKFLFEKMYLEVDITRKYELSLHEDDEYVEQYKDINNFYNFDFGIESEWSSNGTEVREEFKKKELIFKLLSFYFLKEYIHIVTRFEHDMEDKFKEDFLKKFLEYIFIPLKEPKVNKEKLVVYLAIINITNKYFKDLDKVIKKVFKDELGMLDDYKQNAMTLKYVKKFILIGKILENHFQLKNFDSHKKNFFLISESISIDYKLLEKYEKHVQKSALLTDLYNSNIIRWEFFNNTKEYNYRKLSSGEKQLFEFIVNFAYTLKNMKYTNKSIIFIEEVEISMHPEWQKRLLNVIIDVFIKLKLLGDDSLNYHLIFTTHSPFFLSDIPKQNIIFLDAYKEKDSEVVKGNQKIGNCRVLSHDEVLNKKQTFGANIHTLLSDSFFMDDGLMGEFAKKRIENVIKLLKSKRKLSQKNKKLCEDTISIIGEPFLKSKLEKMHEAKFPKTQEEKIAELKAEIERLENGSNKT